MKLVIIHFHLDRGGVTSVVLNHLRALQQYCPDRIEQVILMHGGREAGLPKNFDDFPEFPIYSHPFPELEYDSERGGSAKQLPERLEWTLKQLECHPSDTILHAHNHSLGKNVAFLTAIEHLSEHGWRWLLQVHDFAEDFRPANYKHLRDHLSHEDETFGKQLYPQAEQIHYAVLNGRDREILQQTGVSPDRLHALPNPVFPFDDFPEHEAARKKVNHVLGISNEQRLLVYPVRGIRRKNIGEMLLWSVVGQGELVCANTLPPENPLEKNSYDQWKLLSEKLNLPCYWELGKQPELSFVENLSAADQVITTSVAEGFGMVFLEAWLAGKSLCGRDLPEITRDFKQVGVWYPQLAANFLIPIEFFDLDVVREDFLAHYQAVSEDFGLSDIDSRQWGAEFEALIAGQTLDFAILPREHQVILIEDLANKPAWVEKIRELNPVVQSVLRDSIEGQRDSVAVNAETILSEFSLESTGKILHNVYQALLDVEPDSIMAPSSPLAVRDGFLKMSRFQPLRVEP